MRLRKWIASLLAAVMTISTMGIVTLADVAVTGIPANSWSTEALNAAVSNGLLVGDATGHVQPKKDITRAEVLTVINRAFGASEGSAPAGVDGWYAADLGKAIHMGTVDANDLRPDAAATREEVFSMLGRALQVSGDSGSLAKFADGNSVSAKYQADLAAMVSNGYVNGSADKETGELRLNPNSTITREEFAQVMHNSINQYLNDENVTSVNSGNVMIRNAGTTLDGVSVNGDLIIGDGVGNGDVTIKDSKVSGRVLVRGGGANTIHFENTEVAQVTVAKPSGNIRVKSTGGKIGAVNVVGGTNPVTVSGAIGALNVTGNDLSVILSGATADSIAVPGNRDTVTILENTNVGAVSLTGDHDHLNVTAGTVTQATTSGEGSRLKVDEGAKVGTVTANGNNTVVYGNGEVDKVTVNASNSGVYTGNTDVTVAAGVKDTTVGDKKVEAGAEVKTEAVVEPPASVVADSPDKAETETKTEDATKPSGGGMSGGGGGGGGDTTPTVSVQDIKVEHTNYFSFTASADISAIKVGGVNIPLDLDGTSPNLPVAERSGDSGNVTWSVYLDAAHELNGTAKTLVVERNGYKNFSDSNSLKFVTVTSVEISPDSLTLEVGGSGANLSATVSPSDATQKTITWESDNEAVATVSSTGEVTPVAAGSAAITATTPEGVSDTISVTVNPAPGPDPVAVTGVSLNKTTLSLETGDTGDLIATVTPSDADNQAVTWASDDTSVATVNAGVVTAVAAGTATITVTTEEGGFTADCVVTVTDAANPLASIAITTQPTKLNYVVGETADWTGMVVTATYQDSTTAVVTPTSVTGFDSLAAAASQTITVSYTEDGVTETATFTIVISAAPSNDASVSGITVAGVSATVDSSNDTVYNVELPVGTDLSALTASDVVVSTTDSAATVGTAVTSDGGVTWTVDVTAEDGSTVVGYTINVTVEADPAAGAKTELAKLTSSLTAVIAVALDDTGAQAAAETAIVTAAKSAIDSTNYDVTFAVTSYTSGTLVGKFTVTSKGADSATNTATHASDITMNITSSYDPASGAKTELAKLTSSLTAVIAVALDDSGAQAAAETAIVTAAKSAIDSTNYDVTFAVTSYTSGTLVGKFTVTSKGTDSATNTATHASDNTMNITSSYVDPAAGAKTELAKLTSSLTATVNEHWDDVNIENIAIAAIVTAAKDTIDSTSYDVTFIFSSFTNANGPVDGTLTIEGKFTVTSKGADSATNTATHSDDITMTVRASREE